MLSVVSAVSGSVVAEVPREKVWGKEVVELKKALAPQVGPWGPGWVICLQSWWMGQRNPNHPLISRWIHHHHHPMIFLGF